LLEQVNLRILLFQEKQIQENKNFLLESLILIHSAKSISRELKKIFKEEEERETFDFERDDIAGLNEDEFDRLV
jgi:hypothetical protein